MASYLHVETIYPVAREGRPPVLLVHGAANGAWVWRAWLREFAIRGWEVHALDLRGHGESAAADLSQAGMLDYVEDVERMLASLRSAPVLFGWSMGGLIAQMVAARQPELPALVLFAPSPPLTVQGAGSEAEVAAIPDLFGPEFYGLQNLESAVEVLSDLSPEEQSYVLAHPGQESGKARRERKRGIQVDAAAVRCPVLLIYGEQDEHFPPDLCRAIAASYGAETIGVPGSRHWGIVISTAIVDGLAPAVEVWLHGALVRGGRRS